jgi:6-phosphogluconolactonase (cycloisomerase 2 family)
VDPNSQWLYVAIDHSPGEIAGFSINPITGALTAIPGSPFAAGNGTNGVTITPNDKFLYATNYLDNTISGYSIGANGALTPIAGSPFGTGSGPEGIVVHQSGKWLYNGNFIGNNVSGFSINPATGALTPLPGSPFAPAAGASGSGNLTICPGGNFLFTANQQTNNLSAFTINQSTGVLTQNTVSGNTIPAGTEPDVIVTIAPAGDLNNLLFTFSFQGN